MKETKKNKKKKNHNSINKYLILVVRNPETLTLPSTKDLHTPTTSIPLRTRLPELSLTPVLRDPNIAVGVDAAIAPARGVDKDSNLVVAVEGCSYRSGSAGYVDVFAAEVVDGLGDAPVLLDAAVVHELVVDFGVRDDGGDEEEGAESCEEESEAGEADHCCFCFIVCR